MKSALFEHLLAARREKRPVALVTQLDTGDQALVTADTVTGGLGLDPSMLEAARRALADDRSQMIQPAGDGAPGLFVQSFAPAPRLILVGAVHISQALAPMAALAGYGVTVIDPRRAFATDSRFPDVTLDDDWPDDALARLEPDARTAVVTLTHDPKLDDPALAAAVQSPAFYVGALGSRKTHAARLDRLKALGLADAQLGRIRGPVGLDIGALTPAEIAISILAEITAARRRGQAS
jgi:xanthine dehydrogenase accessory factor